MTEDDYRGEPVDQDYAVYPCTAEIWAVLPKSGRIGRVIAWREFRYRQDGRLDRVHLDPIVVWPGAIAASTQSGRPALYPSLAEADRAAKTERASS